MGTKGPLIEKGSILEAVLAVIFCFAAFGLGGLLLYGLFFLFVVFIW